MARGFDSDRRSSRRGVALAFSLLTLSLAAPSMMARAQTSPPVGDPFARLIDRADAVVLARVLEAGDRAIPQDGGGVVIRSFARIAVEQWIVGPDTARTLEVELASHDPFVEALEKSASQSNRRVVFYLAVYHGTWWLARDVGAGLDRPGTGFEILSTREAIDRVPAIRREAEAASPDSLAARADLVVVGSLGRHTRNSPGVACRVERVIAGTPPDSALTVVTATRHDLHPGRALLLLAARSDGTWKVLHDGAGCFYFNVDRLAHSTAPPETVFARIATAHARGTGRDGR